MVEPQAEEGRKTPLGTGEPKIGSPGHSFAQLDFFFSFFFFHLQIFHFQIERIQRDGSEREAERYLTLSGFHSAVISDRVHYAHFFSSFVDLISFFPGLP